MSHEHPGKPHHALDSASKKSLHKDWRIWAIVILMLGAMGIYVASNDESVAPGIAPGQQIPAAQ